MNPIAVLVHENAGRIAAVAAESNYAEELTPVLSAVVAQLAERLEYGDALPPGALDGSGLDGTGQAHLLRSILFEAIEVCRRDLEPGFFQEAALSLRRGIRPAIPYPDVDPETRRFFRNLLTGECESLSADHDRLLAFSQTFSMTVTDVLYVHDLNGMLLYLNGPGLQLTGFTMKDVLGGLSIYDLLVPEYLSLVETRLEAPGAVSRAPYISEIYTKDGERIPIEIASRPLSARGVSGGRIVGVVGQAKDLRLARRLENEILRSHGHIEALMTHASMGIVVLDGQFSVVDVNPAAESLLGAADASALIGKPFSDLFEGGGDTVRSALTSLWAWVQKESPAWVEEGAAAHVLWEGTTVFGASLDCELDIAPIRQGSNQVDSLLVLITDSGEQAALRRALTATEKDRTVGGVISGVAHDLSNPLTGILGYTELALMGPVEAPVQAKLERIAKEAERCRGMVQNLLSFSRRTGGQKTVYNVNDLVLDALALYDYCLRVDNVDLDLALAEPLPNTLAAGSDIQRAFLHLIVNAHQAMAAEGNDAAPETHGARKLSIRTWAEDERIHIRFADTGPGIPPSLHARVFEPFFTTKDGVGLGLSVSRKIVRDHGGDIFLESDEGQGSAFTVVLPVRYEPTDSV